MTWQKEFTIGTDSEGNRVGIQVELSLKRKDDPNKRTVELKPAPQHYIELSMTGHGGEAYWGQVNDTIRHDLDDFKDLQIDREKLLRMLDVWDEWHLNALKAGTSKQTEALKGRRRSYEEACDILKREGVYVDRGYKYGCAWLLRVLPDELVKEIKTW